MKGYKGFKEGLICIGKQYAENTIFEEDNAKICKAGMHFCENPLDVLIHYPLINDNGDFNEFAGVDALEETVTDDGTKHCTTKIKIGAKLSLKEFIDKAVEFMLERRNASHHDDQDGAQLASSGNDAQLASSGYWAQLASSGYGAKLASSGYRAQLASSGDGAQLASSGNDAQLASSGYGAKLASSGYGAQQSIIGKNSVVANVGKRGKIKGVIGTWITLAEYDDDGLCVCVKSAQIDGVKLKQNTWYTLKGKKFTEV